MRIDKSYKAISSALSVAVVLLFTVSSVSAKDNLPRAKNVPSSVSSSPGDDRGIIIVSGKKGRDAASKFDAQKVQESSKIDPGGAVSLNPQPLPPKSFQRR